MNYTIVAAWYDVRTKENNVLNGDKDQRFFCTSEHYFKSAELFFSKPFPMIIFTEPKWEAKVWEARPEQLHAITRVIVKDYEELNYYCHYKKFEENHNNNPIWNLKLEKFTPLFKFMINQKTEFVKEAIMMNPFSTEMFAWMDMRLHCVYNMSMLETNRVFATIPKDRVILEQMAYVRSDEVDDRRDFYSVTRGKVAAGLFAGHAAALLKFCNLCRDEFLNSITAGFAPTDEMIYSYVIAKNSGLFAPYFGDYGEVLKNMLYVRENSYLALNFLHASFSKGTHYMTIRAADALRMGYFNKEIHLSGKDIHDIWYYDYVANYWLGNLENSKQLLRELYDIACVNTETASHIRSVFDFFKHMISYVNDADLVNKFDKFNA